jgi:RNA-directed DNA polymerase
MGGKRQKIRPDQPELAFTAELRGEAPRAAVGGTELPVAKHATESPVAFERLMEEIVQSENLEQALQRVQDNRGSPGVDGMTVEQPGGYWAQHGTSVVDQLLKGTYQPIPKEGGGMRKLGIPTVLDRMIQQAVMQVLQCA